MNQIAAALAWLTASSHWTGSGSIGVRIGEHLWYTLLALAVAAIIATPAGLAIGPVSYTHLTLPTILLV